MTTTIGPTKLVLPMKQKTLSVKLPEDMLIEYAAAAKVLRARSVSSLTHEWVRLKIAEARNQCTPEEWRATVNEQRAQTLTRSREKAELYAQSERALNANIDASEKRIAYVERHEMTDETKKRKSSKKQAGNEK
jgi:hypothetical protein